jgi:hypothetical protein
MESAGFDDRLGLNSFIQTGQVYAYKILMGNRVWVIASQTHIRLPNGWIFCPISIPMGTIFVSYPYPNRGIPHRLSGIGSPLTSLCPTQVMDKSMSLPCSRDFSAHRIKVLVSRSWAALFSVMGFVVRDVLSRVCRDDPSYIWA